MAPGDYRVVAQRTGFSAHPILTDESGHAISALSLASGQVVTGSQLWFTPDASISGKVLGPDGEPLANAEVVLIARKWQRGKRVYVEADNANTGDGGIFHFSAVPAGRYWVYAGRPRQGPLAFTILDGPNSTETRIAGRYYPNASQLDAAAPIEIAAGGEISGIDFKLPVAPLFHITGAYSGKGSTITLAERYGDQVLTWSEHGAVFGKDGRFETTGVAGNYFLFSSESTQHDQFTGAKVPVTVATHDVADIVVPPVARFELRGRIRSDGDPPDGKLPVRIFCDGGEADAYTSAQRQAEPQTDGTFSIADLTPDRYTIRIANVDTGKEGGYYLKSVRVGGVEAVGGAIDLSQGAVENVELVLSAVVGGMEGTVIPAEEEAGGEPADVTLVAISLKTNFGDAAPVTAYLDPAGHFRVTDLQPGTYRIFAVPAYDSGLWQNPEFLGQIADRGVTVNITEGAATKVQVHALRASEIRQVEERIE